MTNEERALTYMLFRENEELRKLVDKLDAEWKFKDADTCSARYECSHCGYIHEVYCADTTLVCDKCGSLMRNPHFIRRVKEMILK